MTKRLDESYKSASSDSIEALVSADESEEYVIVDSSCNFPTIMGNIPTNEEEKEEDKENNLKRRSPDGDFSPKNLNLKRVTICSDQEIPYKEASTPKEIALRGNGMSTPTEISTKLGTSAAPVSQTSFKNVDYNKEIFISRRRANLQSGFLDQLLTLLVDRRSRRSIIYDKANSVLIIITDEFKRNVLHRFFEPNSLLSNASDQPLIKACTYRQFLRQLKLRGFYDVTDRYEEVLAENKCKVYAIDNAVFHEEANRPTSLRN